MHNKKYEFTVLIEQDEDGVYIAKVPSLKGCHTQAKNMDTLIKRIKEAISLCLEVEKPPLPTTRFIGLHEIEIGI